MEWLFLFLGLPIGIIAARVDVLLSWAVSRARYGTIKISGSWAEWVPESDGRQFSVGVIKYSIFNRRYNFDGTNYMNSGAPYCHWRTISSSFNLEKGQFYYTFETVQANNLQLTTIGYGVVNLVEHDRVWEPEDGYYIYSESPNAAVSVSHTMESIDRTPRHRRENAAALLAELFPEEWASTRS